VKTPCGIIDEHVGQSDRFGDPLKDHLSRIGLGKILHQSGAAVQGQTVLSDSRKYGWIFIDEEHVRAASDESAANRETEPICGAGDHRSTSRQRI
jgi:hypothetical protein